VQSSTAPTQDASAGGSGGSVNTPLAQTSNASLARSFGHLALPFELNVGQTDPSVLALVPLPLIHGTF
jgi:hypothetical protein